MTTAAVYRKDNMPEIDEFYTIGELVVMYPEHALCMLDQAQAKSKGWA